MAHILFEGTSHRYTSPGTKVKVICKGQGQISGSCFSKDGCFRGISVSQTHLVSQLFHKSQSFLLKIVSMNNSCLLCYKLTKFHSAYTSNDMLCF